MIVIYSVSDGKLFTDEKQHFYIDAELLQEKATATKTQFILNRIANIAGFDSIDALRTFTRSSGVTEETLIHWILSGSIVTAINSIREGK